MHNQRGALPSAGHPCIGCRAFLLQLPGLLACDMCASNASAAHILVCPPDILARPFEHVVHFRAAHFVSNDKQPQRHVRLQALLFPNSQKIPTSFVMSMDLVQAHTMMIRVRTKKKVAGDRYTPDIQKRRVCSLRTYYECKNPTRCNVASNYVGSVDGSDEPARRVRRQGALDVVDVAVRPTAGNKNLGNRKEISSKTVHGRRARALKECV